VFVGFVTGVLVSVCMICTLAINTREETKSYTYVQLSERVVSPGVSVYCDLQTLLNSQLHSSATLLHYV
jgi:hypothetical protein